MKVFLSWSGQRSRKVAEALHWWLPRVIQSVEPWISTADIYTGTRWASTLAKTLEEIAFGIVCITEENAASPWLMFEAGAISKAVGNAFVCPYVLGDSNLKIPEALSQFQVGTTTEHGTRNLLQSLNRALREGTVAQTVLDDEFGKWWPELDEKLDVIRNSAFDPDELLGDNSTIYLGESGAVLDQVLARTHDASFVRNTFITFGEHRHPVYTPAQVEKIRHAISRCLSRGGAWHDIVSPDVGAIMYSPVQNLGDTYDVKVTRVPYPVINILLLERPGKTHRHEVIFGWGHFSKDRRSDLVFLSNDPRLVETFLKYWDVLWQDAEKIEAPVDRHIFPTEIEGLWVRLAEAQVFGRDHTLDFAIVEIKSDSARRKVEISGYRFCGADQEEHFTSRTSDLSASTLWFIATRGTNPKFMATGYYEFKRRGPCLRFGGEFVDVKPGGPPLEGDRLRILNGARVIRRDDNTLELEHIPGEGVAAAMPADPDERKEWLIKFTEALRLDANLASRSSRESAG